MTAAWVITDPTFWRKFTYSRQDEIRLWLKMNGIAPANVPVDSTILIAETEDGSWEIRYEEFRRDEQGRIVLDFDNPDTAYIEEKSAVMEIDPPAEWLIPIIDDAS